MLNVFSNISCMYDNMFISCKQGSGHGIFYMAEFTLHLLSGSFPKSIFAGS